MARSSSRRRCACCFSPLQIEEGFATLESATSSTQPTAFQSSQSRGRVRDVAASVDWGDGSNLFQSSPNRGRVSDSMSALTSLRSKRVSVLSKSRKGSRRSTTTPICLHSITTGFSPLQIEDGVATAWSPRSEDRQTTPGFSPLQIEDGFATEQGWLHGGGSRRVSVLSKARKGSRRCCKRACCRLFFVSVLSKSRKGSRPVDGGYGHGLLS